MVCTYVKAKLSNNIANITSDLKILTDYFRLNKLTSNLRKSKLVHSRTINRNLDGRTSVDFAGTEVLSFLENPRTLVLDHF